MKYRLKIVPNATPNADGRWIEVEKPDGAIAARGTSWRAADLFFSMDVPADEHLVQYERA